MRLAHERGGHTQLGQTRTSQIIFVVAEQLLKHREQSTRTGLFLCGGLGQQSQRFVLETDLDPISAKRSLVLPEQTALGILHDVEKIVCVEVLTNHSHRQPADEFRLEPVLNKILSGYVLEELIVHHLNRLGPKSYLCLPNASRHLFFQLLKRTAHHEENVPRVDRLAFCLAAPLKFEC